MKDIHGHELDYAKLSPQAIERLKQLEEDIRKDTGKDEVIILAYEAKKST